MYESSQGSVTSDKPTFQHVNISLLIPTNISALPTQIISNWSQFLNQKLCCLMTGQFLSCSQNAWLPTIEIKVGLICVSSCEPHYTTSAPTMCCLYRKQNKKREAVSSILLKKVYIYIFCSCEHAKIMEVDRGRSVGQCLHLLRLFISMLQPPQLHSASSPVSWYT